MSALFAWLAACAGDGPEPGGSVPLDETGGHDSAVEGPLATGLTLSVHPEVATILVASWETRADGEAWLTWDGGASPVRAVAAGASSEVVLGLPADSAVDVTLHVRAGGAETTLAASATTGSLPAELVAPTLTLATPDADPAPFLLTSVDVGPESYFGPCYVVILDREGRIVWYRAVSDHRLTLYPRVARSGGSMAWEATGYYSAGTPALIRATLSLSHEEETEIPAMGFTWDELPDGSVLYDEAESPYAYHLTRRWPDGTETRIWSCAPWMAAFSEDYWACAANTVLWDEDDDVVIWSMFETSTVVGIDLESGAIAWELGEYPGGLAFAPDDIHLELQHYPNPTPDGHVLLTTHVPGAHQQRIRELAIDPDAVVATQVWTYTPESGYYGTYGGEAVRMGNGDTLVGFGTDGVLQEVTTAGDVVWEVDWADHLVGHVTPLEDLYALDGGW